MFDGSNPFMAAYIMSYHVVSWYVMARYMACHDMSYPIILGQETINEDELDKRRGDIMNEEEIL